MTNKDIQCTPNNKIKGFKKIKSHEVGVQSYALKDKFKCTLKGQPIDVIDVTSEGIMFAMNSLNGQLEKVLNINDLETVKR